MQSGYNTHSNSGPHGPHVYGGPSLRWAVTLSITIPMTSSAARRQTISLVDHDVIAKNSIWLAIGRFC